VERGRRMRSDERRVEQERRRMEMERQGMWDAEVYSSRMPWNGGGGWWEER
jgi:hypothetical protein